MAEFDHDKLMQRIGEFVVSFQWMENKFREIGWLIDDPERSNWPPTTLRNVSNFDLLNKVEAKYSKLLDTLNIDDAIDRQSAFRATVEQCHKIREYRNKLLHSAFIELKAGGEVIGLLRTNPKNDLDPASGHPLLGQEDLTADSLSDKIRGMIEPAMVLNMTYMQLIQWAPFSQLRLKS